MDTNPRIAPSNGTRKAWARFANPPQLKVLYLICTRAHYVSQVSVPSVQ